MSTVAANVSRFQGGAEYTSAYNANRPTPPTVICDILTQLANQTTPPVVVDLGSGTGGSTRVWAFENRSKTVTGVEPSDDMLAEAQAATTKLGLDPSKVAFLKGDSGNVKLESGSVDIITCSQSLHWMEPNATFAEAYRLLRPGGIFASIDCDWPPVINGHAEFFYKDFLDHVNVIGKKGAFEGVNKWEKEGHFQRIKESGKFKFTREILVHSIEKGDSKRLIGLATSMGSFGTLKRKGISEEEIGFEQFKKNVEDSMGTKTHDWYFGYRVRVGIK